MFISYWLDGLRGRLISRYFGSNARRTRRRRSRASSVRSLASSIQTLESRSLLSPLVTFDGQTLIVSGTPNETVQYHFDFTSHAAKTQNEIGIYVADDAQGHVAGLLPSAPGSLQPSSRVPGINGCLEARTRKGPVSI